MAWCTNGTVSSCCCILSSEAFNYTTQSVVYKPYICWNVWWEHKIYFLLITIQWKQMYCHSLQSHSKCNTRRYHIITDKRKWTLNLDDPSRSTTYVPHVHVNSSFIKGKWAGTGRGRWDGAGSWNPSSRKTGPFHSAQLIAWLLMACRF